jgi:hypothetical protein
MEDAMNKKSAMTIAAGLVVALMAGVVGVSRQSGVRASAQRIVVVRQATAAAAPASPVVEREEE